MTVIYHLMQRRFYYIDQEDGESVEEIFTVGFVSPQKFEEGKKYCLDCGVLPDELYVKRHLVEGVQDNSIYVLCYEYSKYENDEFTDYYYSFPPLASEKECIDLKQKLMQEEKYALSKEKLFYDTQDGFYVRKYIIDELETLPEGYKSGFLGNE